MRHVALPRLWRERKELSVSGACGLPLIVRQYAQAEIRAFASEDRTIRLLIGRLPT